MAVSENRVTTEKIIENNKNEKGSVNSNSNSNNSTSGNNPTLTKNSSDKEPGGLLANLPSSVVQFSSFKELNQFAAGKINNLKDNINVALKIPNVDDLLKMTENSTSLNGQIINKALGIFKSTLCGDGLGIDFGLDKLLAALDFRFEFLRDYNVCGRQQLRNPLDVLLKMENQIVSFTNGIKNIDKRLVKNFLNATNQFVRRNKLPIDLQNCTGYKAMQDFANDYRKGFSPNVVNQLKQLLNHSICSSSERGIAPTPKVVQKAAATPILTNMPKFDANTMYSTMTTILDNSDLPRDILLDILSTNVVKKENSKNMIKTLELIAYTKVVGPLNKETSVKEDIISKNQFLNDHKGSNEILLDNILRAHDNQQQIKTSEVLVLDTASRETSDMKLVGQMDARDIICNLKDETEGSQNPERDFNNLVKLIEIADPKFNSKKSVDVLSLSQSVKTLGTQASLNTKKDFTTRVVEEDGIRVYEVESSLNTMDYVNIMNHLTVNEEILVCACAC